MQDAIKVDPEQLVSFVSHSCVALPAGPACSDILWPDHASAWLWIFISCAGARYRGAAKRAACSRGGGNQPPASSPASAADR
eukprot:COSAG01_NODE_1437_length_10311_cov_11.678613_10_plen_82_part_00